MSTVAWLKCYGLNEAYGLNSDYPSIEAIILSRLSFNGRVTVLMETIVLLGVIVITLFASIWENLIDIILLSN